MTAGSGFSSRVSEWLLPLSPQSPAGEDARYDGEHEALRLEIAKLTDVRGETPDWARVERGGLSILTARSKDLLIASYVCAALSHRSGYAGLIEGLQLITGLLASMSGSVHPLRPRARGSAVAWLLERVELTLTTVQPDSDQLQATRALLIELRATCDELLGDQCPSFGAVLKALERASSAVENPAPAPAITSDPEVDARELPAAQSAALLGQQADAWLKPISPDAPSGSDTTYHDAQLAIGVELEKLQGLAGDAPNWGAVLAAADSLLRTETKDLSLAVYLAVALAELHGVAGLALGTRVVVGIARQFWETGWPPPARMRRRASAVEWFVERLTVSNAPSTWTSESAASVASLRSAFEELAGELRRRFGESAPDLKPLEALVERVRDTSTRAGEVHEPPGRSATAPPPEPSPPPRSDAAATASLEEREKQGTAAAPSGPIVQSPTQAARGGESVTGQRPTAAPGVPGLEVVPVEPAQFVPYLRRLGALLIELGKQRFEADRTDARSYRLLRVGLWLPVDELPSANPRGRTEVSPPNRKVCQTIAAAMREEQWELVLDNSELLLRHYPFWLEGQFLSATALEKLGAPYRAAKTVMEGQVQAFVERFPRLLQLQFSDGSTMCPPAVATWLSSFSSSTEPKASQPAFDKALRDGLKTGDAAAVDKLRVLLQGASGGRERFRLVYELAQTHEMAGQAEQALALYAGLDREIDEHRLWDWEPELPVQVWRAMLGLLAGRKSIEVNGASGAVREAEASRIRARLAQLAPTALLYPFVAAP